MVKKEEERLSLCRIVGYFFTYDLRANLRSFRRDLDDGKYGLEWRLSQARHIYHPFIGELSQIKPVSHGDRLSVDSRCRTLLLNSSAGS